MVLPELSETRKVAALLLESYKLLLFQELHQLTSDFIALSSIYSVLPLLIFTRNQHIKLCFRRAELVAVNEQKQKEALKEFYENEILKQKNEDRIKHLKKFSRVINPLFCIGFVIVFWAAGIQHYYKKL